jgi:ribosomal protein S18 acetylase RimI-like enzyme
MNRSGVPRWPKMAMIRRPATGPPLALAVITASGLSRAPVGQVAELTRAAYAESDPLPGLPPPDGKTEDVRSVAAFVNDGGNVWMARDPGGDVVGALRTGRCADGALFVSRVAVSPAWRQLGVGRWLLAAVEERSAAEGTATIRLDAVIERCVPAYYARLGYRVTEHHLAEDDKLLTEVAMERDPRVPRRRELPYPLARVDANVTGTLCWFLSAGGLVAVSRDGTHSVASALTHGLRILGDPAALVAGVDVWRGAAGGLGGALARLPGIVSCRGGLVARGLGRREAVPLHLMPRASHRDLWAALRPFPGAEPPASQLGASAP